MESACRTACVCLPSEVDGRPREGAHRTVGLLAEDSVRTALDGANAAGAKAGKPVAVQGSRVAALLDAVPADATRRSGYDVLVVHATGGGLPTA